MAEVRTLVRRGVAARALVRRGVARYAPAVAIFAALLVVWQLAVSFLSARCAQRDRPLHQIVPRFRKLPR